jgi:uncharacterized membrane protein
MEAESHRQGIRPHRRFAMRELHILAGLVALLAGTVALWAAKGGGLHRRSGLTFTAAMLALTASGAVMAVLFKPNPLNFIGGGLTAYLVATGVLAVTKRVLPSTRGLLALSAVAVAITLYAWTLGLSALMAGSARVPHAHPAPFFLFAIVGTLALAGDVRLLRAGSLQGRQRLTRHLWRMGFALWVATSSFFLGQARFLPEVLRATHANLVPPMLVLAVTVYWLVRVGVFHRGPRATRGTGRTAGQPSPQ